MAEYIDKEAIRKIIHEHHYLLSDSYNSRDWGMFTIGIDQAIDDVPAADVRENVKATWENVEITQTDVHLGNLPTAITSMFCPVCKRYHNEVYFYGNPIEMARFCGFCGAQMGGAEDG